MQKRTITILGCLVGCLGGLGVTADGLAEVSSVGARPVVDAGIGHYTAKTGVSGGLAIAGSETVQPIVTKIASAFRQWQPDVKIAVQGGGTGAAVMGFLQNQSTIRRGDAFYKGHLVSGSVALLAASRPLTEEERKDFASRYGYEVTEIPIAWDAIAVYVNRQNPIEGLTMEQLDAIFGKDRKRGLREAITTWGQAGMKDEWAQQPIHLYGQDRNSGTRSFFISQVLQDGSFRADVREERGPASAILALSRDVLGIGYAGVGFQASTVRIVPLADRPGASFVTPTAETTSNGTYPISRQLYLYANQDPKGEWEPAMLEFLKFVNSQEGQSMVVKAGVYPLQADQVAKNLQVLTGTATSATASEQTLLATRIR
jgi:phosphate transport system substrate-binding protein